jgi:hypothetical protein
MVGERQEVAFNQNPFIQTNPAQHRYSLVPHLLASARMDHSSLFNKFFPQETESFTRYASASAGSRGGREPSHGSTEERGYSYYGTTTASAGSENSDKSLLGGSKSRTQPRSSFGRQGSLTDSKDVQEYNAVYKAREKTRMDKVAKRVLEERKQRAEVARAEEAAEAKAAAERRAARREMLGRVLRRKPA